MHCHNRPISNYKQKKIITCFCLDLTATQISRLLGINRNTINRYFNRFRQKIYQFQVSQKHHFVGEIEVDESYFGPQRIPDKIDYHSIIYSDSWRGYDGVVDVGFDKHYRITHRKDIFARNKVHINGIESFWAFTKQRLVKFRGTKKNFNLHLKEYEWRWRKTPTDLEKYLVDLLMC